ncbi:hypothetical protein [Massilia sp. 9096]|uniref:hypothetical protein n=1 Tax=Massilia sp. 9096 TaxID=1500894 RepID=UPI00068A1D62|nr:hypothetical protein [Massilia sp. 9096]
MRRPACLLACLFACAAGLQSGAQGQEAVDALTRGQPQDVAALIGRIVDCNHWRGEEGYDADRKKEIREALRDLKCDRLDRDEAVVRKRYPNNRKVSAALDKAKDTVQ